MRNAVSRYRTPLSILLCCAVAGYMVLYRPGYLTSVQFLAMLMFLQLSTAILWNYASRFFPFLMIAFLGAATALPLQGLWTSARWFVLGMGALAGLVLYLRDRQHSFRAFHVAAFFAVVAAAISAEVSAYPLQALLKSSSLFLLFLYGASGARLAASGRAAQFCSGLLLGCEILVYLTAAEYFLLHEELFGNPNSLGALMGVVAVPLLLWGILVSDTTLARRRRKFAFCLALLLLLTSYARAGIAAGALSCVLLCVVARRYRLLLQGLAAAAVLAGAVAAWSPPQAGPSGSVSSAFLYKGHQDSGVLGSRTSVWEVTLSTIQEHPWFGIGFGTSGASGARPGDVAMYSSTTDTSREHGNSYLAMAEGVGLVGLLPFVTLILLVVKNVIHVWCATWRSRNLHSLAVPFAAILAAGLVHAGFEDWLFAVGYYLCVFFWALAFMLVDFLPAAAAKPQPAFSPLVPRPGGFAPIASAR